MHNYNPSPCIKEPDATNCDCTYCQYQNQTVKMKMRKIWAKNQTEEAMNSVPLSRLHKRAAIVPQQFVPLHEYNSIMKKASVLVNMTELHKTGNVNQLNITQAIIEKHEREKLFSHTACCAHWSVLSMSRAVLAAASASSKRRVSKSENASIPYI